ncbi:MAG: hypothetical protein KGL39_30310 [Patescibacteria group bacterium]|nr:hypothetical protein [Patescibacteria group bacterium]
MTPEHADLCRRLRAWEETCRISLKFLEDGRGQTPLGEASLPNALTKAAGAIEALSREVAELRAALETIGEMYIPSQPMADDSTEREFVLRHIANMRRVARRAIARAQETTNAG